MPGPNHPGGSTDPWSLLSEMKAASKQQTQGFNHLYICECRKLPLLFSEVSLNLRGNIYFERQEKERKQPREKSKEKREESILAMSLREHLLKTRYCPFKHIKTRPLSMQFSLWYTIMGAFSCLALLQVRS